MLTAYSEGGWAGRGHGKSVLEGWWTTNCTMELRYRKETGLLLQSFPLKGLEMVVFFFSRSVTEVVTSYIKKKEGKKFLHIVSKYMLRYHTNFAIKVAAADDHGAMSCDQKCFTLMWRGYQLLTGSLSNGRLLRFSRRLQAKLEMFSLPSYM